MTATIITTIITILAVVVVIYSLHLTQTFGFIPDAPTIRDFIDRYPEEYDIRQRLKGTLMQI